MNGCRYEYGDRKCHHPKMVEPDFLDWCVEGPCHLQEPDLPEKEIAKEPIFEYNCLSIDGETPAGCPVCPECHEPTYSLEYCAFCGQHLYTYKEG